MIAFITFTTIIHGILFCYDEYVLHKIRKLSQKEVNSSLIAGVLYLVTVAITIFTTYSDQLGILYIVLAALSCITIIINEIFIPVKISIKERLIHAVLYVLHPLILYAFFLSWKMNFFTVNITYWMLQLGYFALGFKAITYHVIYWNYIHDRQHKKRVRLKLED